MDRVDLVKRRVLPDLKTHTLGELAETDHALRTRRHMHMIRVTVHEALAYTFALVDVHAPGAVVEQLEEGTADPVTLTHGGRWGTRHGALHTDPPGRHISRAIQSSLEVQ